MKDVLDAIYNLSIHVSRPNTYSMVTTKSGQHTKKTQAERESAARQLSRRRMLRTPDIRMKGIKGRVAVTTVSANKWTKV